MHTRDAVFLQIPEVSIHQRPSNSLLPVTLLYINVQVSRVEPEQGRELCRR